MGYASRRVLIFEGFVRAASGAGARRLKAFRGFTILDGGTTTIDARDQRPWPNHALFVTTRLLLDECAAEAKNFFKTSPPTASNGMNRVRIRESAA